MRVKIDNINKEYVPLINNNTGAVTYEKEPFKSGEYELLIDPILNKDMGYMTYYVVVNYHYYALLDDDDFDITII